MDQTVTSSLDALGFGVCRVDRSGRCIHINPAGLALLGFEPEDLRGRSFANLVLRADPQSTGTSDLASLLRAMRADVRALPHSTEILWRRDGSSFPAACSFWPIRTEDPVGGGVVTFVDAGHQGAAQDRLTLQVAVNRILAGMDEPEDVLPRLLSALCQGLGCRAGVFWNLSHRERRLNVEATWPAVDDPDGRSVQQLDGRTLGRGQGVPGRAWESGEVVSQGGEACPGSTDRDDPAVGFEFALAIPARVGRRILGVVELLADAPVALDDDLRQSATAIGQQIGQYLRRKRVEESLRQREEEFRAFAENLPQLTWMADATGAMEWFNRRWYDYTGTLPEDVLGWGWRSVQHPDHVARIEATYRASIDAGMVWEETFPLRGKDGRYRWFLSRAVPLLDDEGRIERWFGTNTDITGQRRAEARAIAAERRLRFALQVARVGSWSWAFDEDAIEADEGFRSLLDLPAGEARLSPKEFLDHIHPEDLPAVIATLDGARDSQGEFDLEFRIVTDAGEVRWAVARGVVERRSFARGVHALGIIWDLTERKRHEEDLAAAKNAAEEANRAKSQFIANMSHELRTPLSAIIGYAELLEEEAEDLGPAGESFADDLAKIEGSARHLLSLINGVLDLSKIEAGKMEVDLETFEVAPLVLEVCDTVAPLMAKKATRFVQDLPPGLGSMRSDAVKIRQCLFNLLSNAAKFAEGGDVTLAVRRDSDQIAFEVTDTGIGMTPDQQARLFQRFTQADVSTTRRFGGTGLGLALTKAFADMLEGTVQVRSEEGQGTTFTLSLPIAPRHSGERGPVPESQAPDGNEQVLVIDDDPHMRDLLTRFLARDGLSVVAVADGETGLARAREMRPSAILLDVMMPRMDGWAVLAALKADEMLADIPVIMISMVREKGLAYSLGAADYLTKPIDWQRLKSVVDRHRCQAAPGLALVVESDATTREELAMLLQGEGWRVSETADAGAALSRLRQDGADLILVNVEMPEVGAFDLLRDLRRTPDWRHIPVIGLTEGGLDPGERARLRDQVRQVVRIGEDSLDDLLAEIQRISVDRASGRSGGNLGGPGHG
ncbi:response regulator [Rubellimicrobium arenae]|uniref:response regulator n=1 Tax=Rubellimicrobium arenae TaxID=2817372 RepID=UPI001FEEEDE3|nr:response regulator [Rubellimicrobium arenae]